MEKLKTIIILSSGALTLCMVLIAFSLVVFVPAGPWEKQLITALLLTISPLPLIICIVLLRFVRLYAEKAERYATRDPLTNLYNQTAFWDFLGYETERSKRQGYRFSLLIVDIDNFKAINDTYGHEVGDAYLLEFSKLFKAAVRKGDIPARYGGDNFTAILPICDEAQTYLVANRILDALREHAFSLPDGGSVRITASIGIAAYPDHADDAQDLFIIADGMLNQAKTFGKDRVSIPMDGVNAGMLKSAGEKSILIMEAIRENRIVPYYQPIVCVKEQSVLAYEVLLRIITPERVVPAAEFIEAAEGMGALGRITYLLIEQAFDAVKRSGYQGKLFINLSPKTIVLNEFLPTVRRLMLDHGIESSQMVFEITERDTVKNLDLIKKSVHDLRQEGFRFAIDDFGSGYSSFQYIRTFDVDFVKVDGEIIRNMNGDGNMDKAIVSNIARLAGDLKIKTIAEYVETEAIFGSLRAAGIDYAQGYYIRHPMPDLIR